MNQIQNYKNYNDLNILCNNCGKNGHTFFQCKLPIISYGIILFKIKNQSIEYLMIRRKDSFGYIDFIRGKYNLNNRINIQNIINEMSCEEKKNIIEKDFDELWDMLWGEHNNKYKSEEANSKKKFNLLKVGIIIQNEKLTLRDFVERSTTNWKETEWEFPKGRRSIDEKDIDCALREFEEETGYSKNNIKIFDNIHPFEEIFIGSNFKSYKHKYYLSFIKNSDISVNMENNYQKSEVSKMEWKTFENCLESIRPYNIDKKKLLINIHNILNMYTVIDI
jgi:8-oxo-dGTP pyrophosphatase MutT (NUDIX family)